MAYSEALVKRVRKVLADVDGVVERKMFGGVCFMINGNMCCGVSEEELLLRLGPERTRRALNEPHTRKMDMTGRVIKSMLFVGPEAIRSPAGLMKWLNNAVDFVSQLPPK